MSDYKKTIFYQCLHKDCKVVRQTIHDIESHLHIAHGISYGLIIKPTQESKSENNV